MRDAYLIYYRHIHARKPEGAARGYQQARRSRILYEGTCAAACHVIATADHYHLPVSFSFILYFR